MNKPKTTWQRIKFYLGYCHICGGYLVRWNWHKAYCRECGIVWPVKGL